MKIEKSNFHYDDAFQVRELHYFHSRIFKFLPSKEFELHYLKAQKIYFSKLNPEEQKALYVMVTSNVPLDPVELATRRRLSIIGKKVNSILYIAEALKEYDFYFHAPEKSRLSSFFIISKIFLEVPVKYIWGLILVALYGI